MKNKKTLIIGLAAGIAVLGIVAAFVFGNGQGEAMDVAAKRDGRPDPDAVYIEMPSTALAGALNGTPETQAAAKQAFDQINAIRANNGLGAYVWNSGLESAAGVRAVEAVNKWSHDRPDGTEYWTVNPALVYGENLAKGYFGADAAVQGWMNSPTHKANILDYEFKTAAINIHVSGGDWYWAEEFGY